MTVTMMAPVYETRAVKDGKVRIEFEVCLSCGCLVVDPNAHDDWHFDIESAVRHAEQD